MQVTQLKEGWHNAFYRYTVVYIAVVITLIFAFQMYRYFFDLPSNEVLMKCASCLKDNSGSTCSALRGLLNG